MSASSLCLPRTRTRPEEFSLSNRLVPVYDRLRRNIELNELTNVECINAAVGEREATADFFHVANGLPTSSSLSHDFMRTASDDVMTSSLDSAAVGDTER